MLTTDAPSFYECFELQIDILPWARSTNCAELCIERSLIYQWINYEKITLISVILMAPRSHPIIDNNLFSG